MLKSYPSLLNKDESTAIKGLLILLIVLAHNNVVMEATGLFSYLYAFHVYCFYILPFIYGISLTNTNENPLVCLLLRQWRNWKKMGIIYLVWCLLGIAAGIVWKHGSLHIWHSLYAIFWGHQTFLTEWCGFSFLWFLPTILAVMFWRDVYFMLSSIWKIILLSCIVILWGFAVAGAANYFSLGKWCPLALIQGLYFSMAGIVARFILERLPKRNDMISRYWVLLFPLVPLYVYLRRYLPYGCNFLTWSCCPVIAFISLYAIKDWICRVKLFQLAGKYSLQIYLLHTIIFNILLHITPSESLPFGIGIYLLTLLLCGVAIYGIEKNKIFRWTIFPINQSKTL